jgi:arsenical pump membrane protein
VSEAAALLALVATLGAAIARPRRAPDWAVAAGAAVALVATGVLSLDDARSAAGAIGPTLGFLAALLLLADGCREAGLFDALGAAMAAGSQGRPRRLLAMVFVAAAGTTAVLSLDATVVLLTPVVFATAARLRASARPHVYACTHLANSASLLLPVSNLTNLLAFQASGLSFARFAALMALPWLAALAVEWLVLSRAFRADLELPRRGAATTAAATPRTDAPSLPRFALAVVGLTLAGFAVSSFVGLAPVWVAAAGALAFVVRERRAPRAVIAAAEPPFLLFVLGLALIVRAAGDHGLQSFVDALVPHSAGLLALLAIAALSAVVANLLNNLPATLIVLPVAAAGGPGPVLAMLIGVNVGPNLTYVGSLATLLWRRVVHAHDETTDLGEFVKLGALTVPPALLACTLALWLGLKVV